MMEEKGIAEKIAAETVNKFIKSGFVQVKREDDSCRIAFNREALQWYIAEAIMRAVALAPQGIVLGAGEKTWQPTHRHYKGGFYREIARGRLEADQTPVVIYDNQKGEIWARPANDFDQTEPFVRFSI